MIAIYPAFTKLTLGHKDTVNEIVSHFEPYSDFNFVSLYSWNIDEETEVSLLNDNLIIKMPDYISGEPILSMLGKTKVDESLDLLSKQPLEIKLVPEVTINLLSASSQIPVVHDIDNNDYVFELQTIADLPGQKFKKKRNKLNSFMNIYGNRVSFQEFTLQDDKKVVELKKCFDEWVDKRDKDHADTDNERRAIDRLLEHSHHFDLKCYEVWIDENMVGFSINEILHGQYAICHFQKALIHHINLEVYINVLVAKHLINEGCRYVNWEQDLGLEGLRQAKESYGPIKLLKKYRVNKT